MTLTVQFYTLLAMIGMGSFFGAALDTYNRFLKRSERSRWIVFIHDVLFWVIQAILIFYVLFLVNEGEFRFYLFLAILCGFAMYQALFGTIYRTLLETIIKIVINLFKFIKKSIYILIFLPIKWILTTVLAVLLFSLKSVYSIVLWFGKLLLWVVRVLWKPFGWIFRQIWLMLPEFVTKNVGNWIKKIAGILLKYKNVIYKWLKSWRSKKD